MAVKTKIQKGAKEMSFHQEPKVGLYIRLSRDDLRAGESMSVENQRIFLNKYAKEQGWSNVTEYVDDGYTGVNFAGVR